MFDIGIHVHPEQSKMQETDDKDEYENNTQFIPRFEVLLNAKARNERCARYLEVRNPWNGEVLALEDHGHVGSHRVLRKHHYIRVTQIIR